MLLSSLPLSVLPLCRCLISALVIVVLWAEKIWIASGRAPTLSSTPPSTTLRVCCSTLHTYKEHRWYDFWLTGLFFSLLTGTFCILLRHLSFGTYQESPNSFVMVVLVSLFSCTLCLAACPLNFTLRNHHISFKAVTVNVSLSWLVFYTVCQQVKYDGIMLL